MATQQTRLSPSESVTSSNHPVADAILDAARVALSHGRVTVNGTQLEMKRIEELETPAIVVDASIMRRNIHEMSAYAATHRLKVRPHTKTHKIPEIAHMQVASGRSGITVAKKR